MEIKDTPSQKNRMLIDVGAGIFYERYGTHCVGIMKYAFSSAFGAKRYWKIKLISQQHSFAMAPCLAHLSLHLPFLLSSFLVTHLLKDIDDNNNFPPPLIIFLGRLEYPGCYDTGPEHVEGSQGRQE